MAFQAISYAQIFQFKNQAAQKDLLLEGLDEQESNELSEEQHNGVQEGMHFGCYKQAKLKLQHGLK